LGKYIYGIVGEAMPKPEGSGVAGARLGLIAGDGVAALVSDVADDELTAGREEVLVHARVLEEAMAHGTVLPMRFGVVMDGPTEVRRELLERHATELRQHLDRLEGKVEVNIRSIYEQDVLMSEIVREDQDVARLRASLREQPDDATYYGRIRLGELVAAAVQRKRELDARSLLGELSEYVLDYTLAESAHERVVFTASFLVDRTRLGEFDDAVDRVADAQAGRMRFKYTGPLPPHSFVELAGAV
jgi:hypothetical protein